MGKFRLPISSFCTTSQNQKLIFLILRVFFGAFDSIVVDIDVPKIINAVNGMPLKPVVKNSILIKSNINMIPALHTIDTSNFPVFDSFIETNDPTITDIINDAVLVIGEKISVRRFVRYEMGEGLEKRQDNFAEEVASQMKGN